MRPLYGKIEKTDKPVQYMNGQQRFSDIEYGIRKRTTKREAFLDAMNEVIIWDDWCAYIEPFYYKGKRGRPPKGIEKMLRMYPPASMV